MHNNASKFQYNNQINILILSGNYSFCHFRPLRRDTYGWSAETLLLLEYPESGNG